MATYPKYPPEQRQPGPQPIEAKIARQQRSFKLFMLGVGILIVAVVIFLAVWLLKFGGGSPQEQPKPHQTAPAPSGMFVPFLPEL